MVEAIKLRLVVVALPRDNQGSYTIQPLMTNHTWNYVNRFHCFEIEIRQGGGEIDTSLH